jgi:hypothetical protein
VHDNGFETILNGLGNLTSELAARFGRIEQRPPEFD